MKGACLALAGTAVAFAIACGAGGYDPDGPDRDCGDFDTQREAQEFFKAAGGPTTDRHRLDADNDGIACETLP